MAIKYVSKNGNDGNDGSTWALAKLTIQAAITVASTGDSIYIGQGIYYESLSFGAKGFLFYCFNVVMLNGDNVLATGMTSTLATSIVLDIKQGTFIVQKFTTGYVPASYPGQLLKGVIFSQCQQGIYRSAAGYAHNAENCLFDRCIYGIRYTGVSVDVNNFVRSINNTFVGCAYGISSSVVALGATYYPIYNNVFAYNTYHLYFTGNFDYTGNYNLLYFDGSALCYRNGITYATLGDWQAISGDETNGTSEDPLFVDKDRYAYQVDPASPCLTASKSYGSISISYQRYRGYNGNPSYGVSKNTTDDWADGIFVDTEVDGNGDLCLSAGATTGTWSSPVKDMGVKRRILKTICNTDEGYTNFPTVKVDQDNTSPEAGSMPNRAQFEARISDTAFLKTDVLPAWTVYNLGIELNITGRYFQRRYTLTNVGVL